MTACAGCATGWCSLFCGEIRRVCFGLPRCRVGWRRVFGAARGGCGGSGYGLCGGRLWERGRVAVGSFRGCDLYPQAPGGSRAALGRTAGGGCPTHQRRHGRLVVEMHSGEVLGFLLQLLRGGFAIGGTGWLRGIDITFLDGMIRARCRAKGREGGFSIEEYRILKAKVIRAHVRYA